MKRKLLQALLSLVFCMMAPILFAESFYIAKVYDRHKVITYKVLSQEELKDMEHKFSLEQRAFPKAISEARKLWEKDKLIGHKSFPRSVISPQKVKVTGRPYSKREDANRRLTRMQDDEAARSEKIAERDNMLNKKRKRKIDPTREEREAAVQAARDALDNKAAGLIEDALAKIIAPASE